MKYAVVTGACGGMGKATVNVLVEKGFFIFALDKNVEERLSDNVSYIRTDVTDETSVKRAREKIEEVTKELFAVIHFAGIYALDSFVEVSEEELGRIFDINFFGAVRVNRQLVPLISNGGKIIITTSELAPLDPLPFTGIYAVTKGALDKYAYSLKMELQLLGISVSVIRAGAVDTGMLDVSVTALERFCNKTDIYQCNAEKFKKVVDSVESRKISPKKIAKKAESILDKKNPSFVYSLNRNPLLLILNALPKRFQCYVIRKILK